MHERYVPPTVKLITESFSVLEQVFFRNILLGEIKIKIELTGEAFRHLECPRQSLDCKEGLIIEILSILVVSNVGRYLRSGLTDGLTFSALRAA